MALLLCAFCGNGPAWTGPLCAEPVPYEPTRTRLVCRACVEVADAFVEEMKVMAADAKDWADHLDQCSWCFQGKKLLPRGPLQAMCLERRKEQERKALEMREAVAVAE